MKLDFIKQIMSEFDQSNVTKMKVEIDDLKIELEKESEKVEYVKPLEKENKMVAEVNTKEPTGTPVKSPIVGVFYGASSPESDPDRKSTRLNSSHASKSRMPSSA